MPEGWFEEAVRQLQLTAACQACAALADDHEGGTDFARGVRVRVAQELRAVELLPGLAAILKRPPHELETLADLAPAICLRVAQGWAAVRARSETAPGTHKALADLLCDAAAEALADGPAGDAEAEGGATDAPLTALHPWNLCELWARQAAALRAWRRLGEELPPQPKPVRLPSWERLREGCEQVRGAVAERNRRAWLPSFFLPHLVSDKDLFCCVDSLLDACKKALDSCQTLQRQLDSRDALRAVKRRVDQRLDDQPADWPPRLLAALAGAAPAGLLARVGMLARARRERRLGWEERLIKCEVPLTVQARALLAALVVRALDGLKGDEDPWKRAGTFLEDLLRATGVRPRLLRGCEPQPGVRTEVGDDDGPARVERTGLLLLRGRKVLCRRSARVIVPPERPAAVAALRRLADQLDERDTYLAGLCREIAGALAGHATIGAWWDGVDKEGEGPARLWRCLTGIASVCGSEPVLAEFAAAGFVMNETGTVPDSPERAAGPWFLAPPADGAAPARTFHGPSLRTPDGETFGPSLWLRLPAPPVPGTAPRPWARCLVEAAPLVALLRREDADWPGWLSYNEKLWPLADPPAADADLLPRDARHGLGLLTALCGRADEAGVATHVSDLYRRLAGHLYRCLTEELKLKVQPPLEPDTLLPRRYDTPPPAHVAVTWAEAGTPKVGTVLAVRQFGDGCPTTARVELSPGQPDPAVFSWLALERLPAFGPEALECPVLAEWHSRATALLWRPGEAAAALEQARTAFADWLADDEGRRWFHAFMQAAAEGHAVARAWYRLLRERQWCAAYPDLDPDSGALTWPASWPTAKKLPTQFHDTIPPRHVITGPDRELWSRQPPKVPSVT